MKFFSYNFYRQPYFLGLIFLLPLLLFFGRSISNFFVSDDWHWLWLGQNTAWSSQIFLTNYEGGIGNGSYNPLLVVIFKIAFHFFGLKFYYYHLLSTLLHLINAVLVYLSISKLLNFFNINDRPRLAYLTAFLFLIWPTQVEAVYWIAAWPHLWATLFYLLSLNLFFVYIQSSKKTNLYFSLLFFIFALWIKEIALSLPLLILFLLYVKNKNFQLIKKHKYYILSLFIIVSIFLALRFYTTHAFIGYYGQSSMPLNPIKWLASLAGYVAELFTWSWLRIIFFKIWYHYQILLALLVLVFGMAYFYVLKTIRQSKVIIFSILFLVVLLPVLPLELNRLTFEGERYLYLPSIFFIFWLLYSWAPLVNKHKYTKFVITLIFIYGASLTFGFKMANWRQAAYISREVIKSFENLSIDKGQMLVSVALPDNYQGAQVFRNNLQQALAFYYPQKNIQILDLPIYTVLTNLNYGHSWLNWRRDELGWFAESSDGSPIVTGITSINKHDFYWELWNYNYQNYTANIIRLMPQSETLKAKLSSGEIKILFFDKDHLELLP